MIVHHGIMSTALTGVVSPLTNDMDHPKSSLTLYVRAITLPSNMTGFHYVNRVYGIFLDGRL